MMLLLDTHAFVWLASDQSKLSSTGLKAIQENAERLYISSISAMEIGILVKHRRLRLPVSPEDFIERALYQHGIQEIPVNREIALASTKLPEIHNDPFDRLLIATAVIKVCVLLSKDKMIPQYQTVKVLWD